jgi:hypothetical protein
MLAAVLATTALSRGPTIESVTPRAATVAFRTVRPAAASLLVHGLGPLDAGDGAGHVVRLRGLVPGRRYRYTVRIGAAIAARGSFRAAPVAPAPFTFAVVGDYGSGDANERAVARLIGGWHPDFVLTTGDNTYPVSLPNLLDPTIFRPYAAVMREAAWFPSLGNHDVYLTGGAPYLAAFHLPGAERWYRFGWGDATFTVLDSTYVSRLAPGSAQVRFARRALAAPGCLRFAAWHHPPWSPASAGIAPALRRTIVPLVERGRTQVVFLGHVHSYERSVERRGVTYVTVGTGGAEIGEYGASTIPHARLVTHTFGALRVDVRGRSARFRFVDVHGRVRDAFARRC